MNILISVGFGILMGMACRNIALSRKYPPTPWFYAGFFFGIFALLILLFLPARKKFKAVKEIPIAKVPKFTPIFADHVEKFWYFLDEEQKQFGPMSFDALGRAKIEGKVHAQTYVWNEAMENWRLFKDAVQEQ
jgi:hypothetical protein